MPEAAAVRRHSRTLAQPTEFRRARHHLWIDVTVTSRAIAYARKRGGKIYVWVDREGLTHVSTLKPGFDRSYWESHHLHDDVTVHLPRQPEATWNVDRRLFPRPHLIVTTNMTSDGFALTGTGAPYW